MNGAWIEAASAALWVAGWAVAVVTFLLLVGCAAAVDITQRRRNARRSKNKGFIE